MESILQDIRLAVRNLYRRPAFSATVIVTVALALGATTAIFSVVNGVLLKPLPHPDPDQIVNVYEVDERPGFLNDHNNISIATFVDWRAMNHSFEKLAAYRTFRATFRDDENAYRIPGGTAGDQFFEVMGARPMLGRLFVESDFEQGASVVVISYEFWQERLAGDPDVIGSSIRLEGDPEVVGVLEPGFEFQAEPREVWFPLSFTDDQISNRRSHTIKAVGRLLPATTVDAAQRDMQRVSDVLTLEYPRFLTGFGVNVVTMEDDVVGPSRPAIYLLMGGSVLLLIIAAVNIANLLLVRLKAEEQTYSVRAALGAGRGRLVIQAMTETLVLAIVGGIAGLGIAYVGLDMMLVLAAQSLPRTHEVGLDLAVLGYAALATVVVGVAFGIIPAVQGSRAQLTNALRESAKSVAGGTNRRLRDVFVVVQVAFSLVLMISTALLSATFVNLVTADSGFEAEGVLTASLALNSTSYPTTLEQGILLDEIERELGATPGIEHVGFTRFVPLKHQEWTWSIEMEGGPAQEEGEKRDYGLHPVHGALFEGLGMELVEGRLLNSFDNKDGRLVTVVNEPFVARFYPDGRALGKRIKFSDAADWIEIVGVVKGMRHYELSREPEPAYFLPLAQMPYDWFFNETSLIVRGTGDIQSYTSAVRSVIGGIDSNIPITEIRTMESYVSSSVARTMLAMTLLGVFAVVALALVTIGIYGVMSHSVGQRAREIGIRLALGAEPRVIVRSFVTGGLKTTLIGIVVGIGGAAAAGRVQATLLYGADPVEPGLYLLVAAIFAAVAAIASYVPASRAGRLDASEVLRES